ncbi:MAG: hypothetical protein ACE15F_22535, partial [bacterium]
EGIFVGADLGVRPNHRVDGLPISAAGTHLSYEPENSNEPKHDPRFDGITYLETIEDVIPAKAGNQKRTISFPGFQGDPERHYPGKTAFPSP